ncbi:hypothetical protein [Streptomyces parvus]|uniref:hypothetical protein n=1 Tax=Streptomyces parvus TaxID=66428 RepID=UPI003D749FF7
MRCLADNGPILYAPVGRPHRCEECGAELSADRRPSDELYWAESYGYLVEAEDVVDERDPSEQANELYRALRAVADVLGDSLTSSGVAGHFNCNEADKLAKALMVGGNKRAAMGFLGHHAAADDDEDDLHGEVEDFEAYVLELAGLPVPELIEEPEPEPKEHDLPTVTVDELIILIGL